MLTLALFITEVVLLHHHVVIYRQKQELKPKRNEKRRKNKWGHFDYWQYHIKRIAEDVKDVITKNMVKVPNHLTDC